MAQWVGVHGQVKVATETQKHPYLWRSPPNPKRKFFFDLNYDLLNP